jgi:hypothetical protein
MSDEMDLAEFDESVRRMRDDHTPGSEAFKFFERIRCDAVRNWTGRTPTRTEFTEWLRPYLRRDDPGDGGASVREPLRPRDPSLGSAATVDE